jgi:uroporphyrinogen-III synthase
MKKIYLLSPTSKPNTIPLPMIEFETLATSLKLDVYDTLMFTSKQAVIEANNIDKRWKELDTIAIGGATKSQIERLGGKVIYHPKEFYGSKLAKDIESFFKDRKILYLRPQKISFDSKAYLAKSGIKLGEQIIYQTKCKHYDKNNQPPKDSIIIFTSPSTIECFLKNFDWLESYKAIVIGESTKSHLPPNATYFVASKPLIDACIQKALEI